MAYGSQWLPWSLSPGFPYYMLACLPWMTLLLGFGLDQLARRRPGQLGIAAYLLMAAVVLGAYLPLWTALEIPQPVVRRLLSLPDWP